MKQGLWTKRPRLITVGTGENIHPVNYDGTVMICVSCLRWVPVCLAHSSRGNGHTTTYKWQCASHCGDTCGRICFWNIKVWLNIIVIYFYPGVFITFLVRLLSLFSPLEGEDWSQINRPLGRGLSSYLKILTRWPLLGPLWPSFFERTLWGNQSLLLKEMGFDDATKGFHWGPHDVNIQNLKLC